MLGGVVSRYRGQEGGVEVGGVFNKATAGTNQFREICQVTVKYINQ